jgi:hypothetical protein
MQRVIDRLFARLSDAAIRRAIRVLSILGLLAYAAEVISFVLLPAVLGAGWLDANPVGGILSDLFWPLFWFVLILIAGVAELARQYAMWRAQRGWRAGFAVLGLVGVFAPFIAWFILFADALSNLSTPKAGDYLAAALPGLVPAVLFVAALTYSLLPISRPANLDVTAPKA